MPPYAPNARELAPPRNPLDEIIGVRLKRELTPEQAQFKAQLEASIAARQPEVNRDQRDVEHRRIAREAPQAPLAESTPPRVGPGWPRAALDAFNRGTAFMRGVGDMTEQGVGLGFADEAGAGIGAGVDKLLGRTDEPFGDVYRQHLSERQETNQGFREDHPVAALAAEVAGSLPTAAVGGAVTAASKLPLLARALIGGSVGGGAYGAGSSAPGERAEGAALGAGLGAGLGAAGVGVGKAIAARAKRRAGDRTIKDAATQDELRTAADAQYKIADAAEGQIPVRVFAPFVEKLATTLKGEGADHLLHPRVARVLSVMARSADKPPSLQDLQILRRQFGVAAKSAEPDERRLGRIAIDALDDFVDDTAGQLGSTLKEGRALWARMKKSEIISDAIERATSRTAGKESGLRNEFAKLFRNKKMMRGFSAEEKSAIFDVSAGTPTRNAARILGGLSIGEGQRRSILNALVGGGVGLAAMGPGGGMLGLAGPAIVGGISQRIAEKGTRRAAELARALAAGPRPGATPSRPVPGMALDQFLREGAQRRLVGPQRRLASGGF